jgi:hypothetical protein
MKNIIGVKVTDLLADGIMLEEGDMILHLDNLLPTPLVNSRWAGQEGLSLFREAVKVGFFDGFYVTKFADRKNLCYKEPLPSWVPITYTHKSDTYKDLVGGVCWGKKTWSNSSDTWKPDLTSLMVRYLSKPHTKSCEIGYEHLPDVHVNTPMPTVKPPKSSTCVEYNLSEDPIYTKEMFDKGVLPEKGMLIKIQILNEMVYVVSVCFNSNHTTVIHWKEIEEGNFTGVCGNIKLWDLVFPEKTFMEKVVDKITPFWEDNINLADAGVIENTYKAFKRIEKEIEDEE